ncbi:MAG TPA: inositol monophosphatase [Alphaproteobacteria bacterium]|nr:inositol monophosphatase [Alphaproteobacteria bacterium]
MTPDPEKVAALLRRAASEIILPRFRNLQKDEIREKGPGDLVTIADTEAEQMLAPLLRQLAPGSVVVGEEAVAADADVLDHLSAEGVWLIDPVDGTFNFVHGNPNFAVMAAYVERGSVRAGWIHEPLENETVWAVAGEGAWHGAERLRLAAVPPPEQMVGSVSGRTPRGARARDVLQSRREFGPLVNIRCAGRTYTGLARGQIHYAYFSRSRPWDHAAGWLIYDEAGGRGAFLDGEAYTPRRADHPLLLAPDDARWSEFHALLTRS